MDVFTIVLFSLGTVLFVTAIYSIIAYLRYLEARQNLPEACNYLDLSQRNANLKEENAILKKDFEQLVEKEQEKKANLEKLKTQLEVLESNMVEIAGKETALSTSVGELKRTIDELEARKASLMKENEIQAVNNEEAKRSLQEIQDMVGQEQDKLSSIQEQLSDQEKLIENNRMQIENQASKETALSTSVGELKRTIDELEARKASLMKENEIQAVNNEEAKRSLQEYQDMVGREQDKLSIISAEYTEKKVFLDSFQARKDALQKEIDIIGETLEDLRKKAGIHTSSNDESLKDLWEPVVFPPLSLPRKEKSELDLLSDTKEYIRGKGLYFPDRIIHAFHTSLKCNDISPMTVLAGISGTGKSELPKCYAEGMGIHFAMLAVQPRWDSPQDLLGFYNYMENRYKATELARALVRFDRFNRKSWGDIPAECDDRSDRMLLILLDEMNLARVEYYFSEFLSKLETRRGVDIMKDNDRVKAEIELEIIGRPPLRIFPDRNILFTGTMNEDESTQSLSDKVLDRANVLRFGKPQSANISDKLGNAKLMDPRSEGLSYDSWQKWCISAKEAKMDELLTDWINRLNNAMEALQKPFGHRVAQAIATYVANYPKNLTNGHEMKIAFADQIEQRIMPKLRGIDVELNDEPLKRISELIDDTQDELLSKAYSKACQDSSGIFLWQGVDRSGVL